MNDVVLVGGWCALLAAVLVAIERWHRRGLAPTHARDLVHVGASVWVLGWPAWHGAVAPVGLASCIGVTVLLAPVLGRWFASTRRVIGVLAAGDELWSGIALYALSYVVGTCLAFGGHLRPAAIALVALSLGDGVGGFVGRRWGRRRFRVGRAKMKSVEGCAAVALMAALGILTFTAWLGEPSSVATALVLGVVAMVAEAVAPRGTDNLVVPLVVGAAVFALDL